MHGCIQKQTTKENVLFIHNLSFYFEIHLPMLFYFVFKRTFFFLVVLKKLNQHFALLDNTLDTIWMT